MTPGRIEELAYRASTPEFELMMDALVKIQSANTNGDAMGALASFRKATRIEAIRAALVESWREAPSDAMRERARTLERQLAKQRRFPEADEFWKAMTAVRLAEITGEPGDGAA